MSCNISTCTSSYDDADDDDDAGGGPICCVQQRRSAQLSPTRGPVISYNHLLTFRIRETRNAKAFYKTNGKEKLGLRVKLV